MQVSSNGLSYRKPNVWQSQTILLLTQKGFPWGRAVLPSEQDPARFSDLTSLYAEFANSDAVRSIMLKKGASKDWKLTATPLTSASSGASLPVLTLAGQATSPRAALTAARLGREAFLQYVLREQEAAVIPSQERIDIQVLEKATPATVVQGQKKILPIVIFIAVLSATIGLAFVLENLRPRVEPAALPESGRKPVTGVRASA